jgi:hypothetical protein
LIFLNSTFFIIVPKAREKDAFNAEGEVFFLEGLGVDGLEVLDFDFELPAKGDEGGLADLEFISDFGVGQALGTELDELVFRRDIGEA